jgi:hypothetical protein
MLKSTGLSNLLISHSAPEVLIRRQESAGAYHVQSNSTSSLLTPPVLPPFPPCQSQRFVSATIMAPQLEAAQHLLIKALLKKVFETELIASEASCSV